ncbi:hypothetical protein [Allobranchiibius sp. CTAmp26]|uniref:hypothetical protein n=1 Tax=Allobranchiibius sp. CTAmp26 TaxID=2815214 RepID=UPI001AA10B5B|nr:hypothetical protein [Allobranchiibius sp. CTAmp26]MBO1755927.1 hypothetical protein [Allobranchiibius sp. CTAmp26]
MTRPAAIPTCVLAIALLALTGCSGKTDATRPSGSSTRPSATSTTSGTSSSTSSSTPSSASESSSATPTPSKGADPLGAIASSDFESALLSSVQVSRFAQDMTRSTDGDDTQFSGEGGTCPELAKYAGSAGVLPGGEDSKQEVSYDNSDVIDTVDQLRGIDEIIETHASGDPVAALAGYRAAIVGCDSAIVGDDGSRYRVRLTSAPRGYGRSVLSVEVTVTSAGEAFRVDETDIVSGRNVLGLATTGFAAAERSKLLAKTWSNLSTHSGGAGSV